MSALRRPLITLLLGVTRFRGQGPTIDLTPRAMALLSILLELPPARAGVTYMLQPLSLAAVS